MLSLQDKASVKRLSNGRLSIRVNRVIKKNAHPITIGAHKELKPNPEKFNLQISHYHNKKQKTTCNC